MRHPRSIIFVTFEKPYATFHWRSIVVVAISLAALRYTTTYLLKIANFPYHTSVQPQFENYPLRKLLKFCTRTTGTLG